jgi:hypothetical protein
MDKVPRRRRDLAIVALKGLPRELLEQHPLLDWRIDLTDRLADSLRGRQAREGVKKLKEQAALGTLGLPRLEEPHQS